jgi:predicted kinase
MIADDEADQSVSADAFSCLYSLAKKRLKNKRLTVVDATSVQIKARQNLHRIAATYRCPSVAIVFQIPLAFCLKMNLKRSGRQTPPEVVKQQNAQLLGSLPHLPKEGFVRIYRFSSLKEVYEAKIVRRPELAPDPSAI